MRYYCSQSIYFDSEDGYYHTCNSDTQYVTEEEAIEALID